MTARRGDSAGRSHFWSHLMTRIRTILAAFALALFGAVAPLHYAPSSGLGYQAASAQSLTD